MHLDDIINEHFPGAVSQSAYLSRSHSALYRQGFSRSTALSCIGACRDELTLPFRRSVYDLWGHAFDATAAAGLPTLGRTGFAAAADHGPIGSDGRRRFVTYNVAHIAVGRDGAVGECQRVGQVEPSVACGALDMLRSELAAGITIDTFDPDDPEMSQLRSRLVPRVPEGVEPDLVMLTKVTHTAIVEDLGRQLAVVDTEHVDYAVLTVVLIHGHGGREMIWPGVFYAVVAGERRELALE